MIDNTAIAKIAQALGKLNNHTAFVGGAVLALYVNDTGAETPRPTRDIDIAVNIITNANDAEALREQLTQQGFTQSHEDSVICRFRFDGILVDVMATKEVAWAPSNRWFAPGFAHLKSKEIAPNCFINILPLPYFMATKFEAFNSRGGTDPRFSHDFEDIVYLMDSVTDWDIQITNAPDDVKKYLLEQLNVVQTSNLLKEAINGNIPNETRFKRLLEKIKMLLT